jgi:predicted nucleic acid-binding protein
LERAFVDTSCLVAIALGERGAASIAARLKRFEELFASNLLEAELRAAMARERVVLDPDLLTWLDWVFPDRPLSEELSRVFAAGSLHGADAWHLACAAHMTEDAHQVTFLTLDRRQRAVARRLGFRT